MVICKPAEALGEGHLLLVGDVLVVEDQHRIPVKSHAKPGKGLLTEGRGRVNAPHFGCDVCSQRDDGQCSWNPQPRNPRAALNRPLAAPAVLFPEPCGQDA